MKMLWVAPLAVWGLGACDKKSEPAPVERVAAVVEKAPVESPRPPPEIKTLPNVKVEAPKIETPKAEAPVEERKAAEPKVEEPKVEEPKVEEPKVAAPKTEAVEAQGEAAGTEALMPELVATDAAVTGEIVDRMPAERRTTWKIGEDAKLIGWFEFKNPGATAELELVWKKNGVENWRFPTSVGSGKNWRTWAEKRITKKDAGSWTVEAVDTNGHVYQSLSYTVE